LVGEGVRAASEASWARMLSSAQVQAAT
jgi:hypothetical protein